MIAMLAHDLVTTLEERAAAMGNATTEAPTLNAAVVNVEAKPTEVAVVSAAPATPEPPVAASDDQAQLSEDMEIRELRGHASEHQQRVTSIIGFGAIVVMFLVSVI